MKNITVPQVIALVACMAAPIAAYKFLASPEAAGVAMLAGMVLNFLLGRDAQAPAPAVSGPQLKALQGGKEDESAS